MVVVVLRRDDAVPKAAGEKRWLIGWFKFGRGRN